MPHVQGRFVTRACELPLKPGTFNVDLPVNGDFAVHGVVAEGEGSALIVEQAFQCPTCADLKAVSFHVIADDVPHSSSLPADCLYIGSYYVVSQGWLHVYGQRGLDRYDRRLM